MTGKVALQHERIANQRRDFYHKLRRRLADGYDPISFESLHINGLLRNHWPAKAIGAAGWAQFVDFTMYEAQGNGGKVSKVGQFFPSSRLCSDCSEKNDSLTLSVRQWLCLVCGAVHDRDENAAINILNASTGGAPESNALGNMIPVRESAQEAHCL